MRWRVALWALGILVLAVGGIAAAGQYRWGHRTEALTQTLIGARRPVARATVAAGDSLPAPLRRYLTLVGAADGPAVRTAEFRHTGLFNLGDTVPRWAEFSSRQWVETSRPGFVWDARIRLAPGLRMHVHDAYVDGRGVLEARLLGLFAVVDAPSTPALAEGELYRWLAEAAWYPTALRPDSSLTWEALDDSTSRATLRDGPYRVSLTMHFGADGLLARVSADARMREVAGAQVPTPWEGQFWNYAERDGLRIPLEAEVAWIIDGVRLVYWRGTLRDAQYEFAVLPDEGNGAPST